jgi:hypothetical protein
VEIRRDKLSKWQQLTSGLRFPLRPAHFVGAWHLKMATFSRCKIIGKMDAGAGSRVKMLTCHNSRPHRECIMKHMISFSLLCLGIYGLTATARQPYEIKNFKDSSLSMVCASFMLRSVPVLSVLTTKMIVATPDWSPKEPLPISISNAVEIAEAEINRYATFQPVSYQVSNVSIRSLGDTQNKKWYFMITFKRTPDAAKNDPQILVDFAGHVGVLEAELRGQKLELK